ncbi:MAG TPA: hypothetical protein VK723_01340, partial [Thermoplasmata archaeon]|nr:hypothetical protein [Thermoplasmata archaeon]
MDREHRGLVAGPDHGTPGDETGLLDPGLLEDLAAGPPERGFESLHVSGDSRPYASERLHPR